MSEIAHQNHSEKKAFLVNSSSLRDVRSFCRGVFEKLQINNDLKEELVSVSYTHLTLPTTPYV